MANCKKDKKSLRKKPEGFLYQ